MQILRTIRAKLGNEYVEYKGVRLPVRRSNQALSNNQEYIEETKRQISMFLENSTDGKTVLDFGCGQGRLLNGLIYTKSRFSEYVGLDVDYKSVGWCIRNLRYTQSISFIWYNQSNSRYNKTGENYAGIPVKDNYFSHVFANSVFSHLNENDLVKYAGLLRKSIRVKGRLYLTAFTEEKVEKCAVNPDGYMGAKSDTSPLHRVRYNKQYFINIFEQNGWRLEEYSQNGIGRTGQSELLFIAVES
jgi:SAM-dependent methyltransferase